MKTVLLVIDGMSPRRRIIDYALQFCRRIKADLKILQVIDIHRECMGKIRDGAGKAKQYVEDAMMASTFAEADAPDIAEAIMARARENARGLLPESDRDGLGDRYEILAGDLRKETVSYVKKHRDVVVTILDTPNPACGHRQDCETVTAAINRRLNVPLVVARD